MFTICQMVTGITLRCIFFAFETLLCFGLLSYNRHMSCVTKSFIEKMWEFGDIDRVEALKVGVWLMVATILARLVAGALPSWAHILHLLFLPAQVL